MAPAFSSWIIMLFSLPLASALASVVLVMLFALCWYRSAALKREYAQRRFTLTVEDNKRLVAAEQRWRVLSNVLAFLCWLPLPLAFLLPVGAATEFLQRSFQTGSVAALIVAAARLLLKVKFGGLFRDELEWKNLLALWALGVLAGLLLALLLAAASDPALWSALRDQLGKAQ